MDDSLQRILLPPGTRSHLTLPTLDRGATMGKVIALITTSVDGYHPNQPVNWL
jgi:hypothetical protein